MKPSVKQEMAYRRRRLLKIGGLLLLSGLAYAFVAAHFGLSVPCPIRSITGLYCPGCGITRMILALLRLDFTAAWRYNQLAFVLILPLLVLLLRLAGQYIRLGQCRLTRIQNCAVWCMIVLLLSYGAMRNIPGLYFLRPPL